MVWFIMLLLYNRKDISGDYYIEDYFGQVVETHVLVLFLLFIFWIFQQIYSVNMVLSNLLWFQTCRETYLFFCLLF